MMRYLPIATLLGATLLFVACQKETQDITEFDPRVVSFATQVEEIDEPISRGTPITAATQMTTMGIFAYNTGTSTWAQASATATSNYMHDQLVTQESAGKWSYEPMKYWPKTNTSIFAYAPHATADNGIMVQSSTYTGAPTIQYTVPVTCVNQPDLMVAIRQTDMNSGAASLAMKHALACISFKVAGTNENITKIAIKGVSISGILNLDNEGGVPVWDLDPATDTEYISGIKNDLTANSTITDATTADGHLMMIPQTLGANAKIILTVDGVSKEISLSGKKWEAGKKTVYSINIRPTGSADILYFDTNDNNRLKVGKWDIEVDNTNIAFFKFGSVIGFTMISGSDTWDDDDVKFNTTKGAYTTYSTIPLFEKSDYVAGISNVSDIQYHTGTNIKTHGKGDPCKLAGLTASEIQMMTEQEVNDYQSGWRLPTTNEYVDFVQAPTSWYGKDNSLSNEDAPYYGISQSGNRYGGWFPIPGNREDITGRGPRSTDPNGYLPAMGNRSADSSPVSATSIGYYWSSTSLSGATAYYLSIARTYLRPNNRGTVEYGFTIRCVRYTK